jgi:hypothetical protein
MTALFVSSLARGGTCEMRRRTLEEMGWRACGLSYEPAFQPYTGWRRKLQWHLRAGPALDRIHQELVAHLRALRPDMLWVEKGWFLGPAALQAARACGVRHAVLYSPDNYFLKQNHSRHLWRALPLYDLVVTTKPHNLEGLALRGAKRVLLSGNAFDPAVHRPVSLSREESARYGSDVCFVGRWEPEREPWLEAAARLGVRLAVWGYRWERARSPVVRSAFRGGPALEQEYAKAICASRINLGLLSRLARDTMTQRSVEIPACGGFLLAERTAEHRAHFAENREAAYFEGPDEMCRKILYYLEHEGERREIAGAGRQRCVRAGYSYRERLASILDALEAGHAAVARARSSSS